MSGGYLQNISFLIVDDCAFSRHFSASLLRCFGAQTLYEALDGEDAKHQLADYRPDIVLLDWMMPHTNGIEFARWVRTDPASPAPFIPMIMMSSYADAPRVLQARDAGINEFLVKPATPKQLIRRVQLVIEKPRAFVRTADYFGPDRRRNDQPFPGPERRATHRRPACESPLL